MVSQNRTLEARPFLRSQADFRLSDSRRTPCLSRHAPIDAGQQIDDRKAVSSRLFCEPVSAKISRIQFLKPVILDRVNVGDDSHLRGHAVLMVDGGHDGRDPPLAIDIFGYNFDDVVGRVAKFRHCDRLWMTGIGRDHADKERQQRRYIIIITNWKQGVVSQG